MAPLKTSVAPKGEEMGRGFVLGVRRSYKKIEEKPPPNLPPGGGERRGISFVIFIFHFIPPKGGRGGFLPLEGESEGV